MGKQKDFRHVQKPSHKKKDKKVDKTSKLSRSSCHESFLKSLEGIVQTEFESKKMNRKVHKELERYPLLAKAVFLGCDRAVDSILEAGENVNIQALDGSTPLMIAVENGYPGIVQKLLKKGADPKLIRQDGRNALMVAVAKDDNRSFNLIWNHWDKSNIWELNHSDLEGYTALTIAVEQGNTQLTMFLLSIIGVEIDRQTKEGWTALMFATTTDKSSVVQKLLVSGSDVLLEDKRGATAICLAIAEHKTEVKNLLIESLDGKSRDTYVKKRIELLSRPRMDDDLVAFYKRTLFCVIFEIRICFENGVALLVKYRVFEGLLKCFNAHQQSTELLRIGFHLAACLMYSETEASCCVLEELAEQYVQNKGADFSLRIMLTHRLKYLGDLRGAAFLTIQAGTQCCSGKSWLRENYFHVSSFVKEFRSILPTLTFWAIGEDTKAKVVFDRFLESMSVVEKERTLDTTEVPENTSGVAKEKSKAEGGGESLAIVTNKEQTSASAYAGDSKTEAIPTGVKRSTASASESNVASPAFSDGEWFHVSKSRSVPGKKSSSMKSSGNRTDLRKFENSNKKNKKKGSRLQTKLRNKVTLKILSQRPDLKYIPELSQSFPDLTGLEMKSPQTGYADALKKNLKDEVKEALKERKIADLKRATRRGSSALGESHFELQQPSTSAKLEIEECAISKNNKHPSDCKSCSKREPHNLCDFVKLSPRGSFASPTASSDAKALYPNAERDESSRPEMTGKGKRETALGVTQPTASGDCSCREQHQNSVLHDILVSFGLRKNTAQGDAGDCMTEKLKTTVSGDPSNATSEQRAANSAHEMLENASSHSEVNYATGPMSFFRNLLKLNGKKPENTHQTEKHESLKQESPRDYLSMKPNDLQEKNKTLYHILTQLGLSFDKYLHEKTHNNENSTMYTSDRMVNDETQKSVSHRTENRTNYQNLMLESCESENIQKMESRHMTNNESRITADYDPVIEGRNECRIMTDDSSVVEERNESRIIVDNGPAIGVNNESGGTGMYNSLGDVNSEFEETTDEETAKEQETSSYSDSTEEESLNLTNQEKKSICKCIGSLQTAERETPFLKKLTDLDPAAESRLQSGISEIPAETDTSFVSRNGVIANNNDYARSSKRKFEETYSLQDHISFNFYREKIKETTRQISLKSKSSPEISEDFSLKMLSGINYIPASNSEKTGGVAAKCSDSSLRTRSPCRTLSPSLNDEITSDEDRNPSVNDEITADDSRVEVQKNALDLCARGTDTDSNRDIHLQSLISKGSSDSHALSAKTMKIMAKINFGNLRKVILRHQRQSVPKSVSQPRMSFRNESFWPERSSPTLSGRTGESRHYPDLCDRKGTFKPEASRNEAAVTKGCDPFIDFRDDSSKVIQAAISHSRGKRERQDRSIFKRGIRASKRSERSDRSKILKLAFSEKSHGDSAETTSRNDVCGYKPHFINCQRSSRWYPFLIRIESCVPLVLSGMIQPEKSILPDCTTKELICSSGKIVFSSKEEHVLGERKNGSHIGLMADGNPVVVRRLQNSSLKAIEYLTKKRRLSHRNIAVFYCVCSSPSGCEVFSVTELIEYSLPEYMNLEHYDGKYLVQELIEAIGYLHRKQIVHGFLKPSNVMITLDDRLKLTDFYLLDVKPLQHGILRKDNATAIGRTVLSDFCWRPYECIAAASVAQARKCTRAASDIQMTGMLIYYILSDGGHPFGSSDLKCQDNIRNGLPEFGSRPADVESRDLIHSMIAKMPSERINIQEVKKHPYLWTIERRYQFLVTVGRKIDFFTEKPTRFAEIMLETCTEGRNWTSFMDCKVLQYISKETNKIYADNYADLLRFIAAVKDHFPIMPHEIKKLVYQPSVFIFTFFPTIFMSVYNVVRKSPCVQRQMALQEYFCSEYSSILGFRNYLTSTK